jgi:NADP-dependent 3-hydroxy acid dehydrogenase YdfG
VALDVRDTASIQSAIAKIYLYQSLDIVINNAGVGIGPLERNQKKLK